MKDRDIVAETTCVDVGLRRRIHEKMEKQLEFYKIHISIIYKKKIQDTIYEEYGLEIDDFTHEFNCCKCNDIIDDENEEINCKFLNDIWYCKKCAVDYINFRDVIYLRNI